MTNLAQPSCTENARKFASLKKAELVIVEGEKNDRRLHFLSKKCSRSAPYFLRDLVQVCANAEPKINELRRTVDASRLIFWFELFLTKGSFVPPKL